MQIYLLRFNENCLLHDMNKFICFKSIDVDTEILDKRNGIAFYARKPFEIIIFANYRRQ